MKTFQGPLRFASSITTLPRTTPTRHALDSQDRPSSRSTADSTSAWFTRTLAVARRKPASIAEESHVLSNVIPLEGASA